MAMNRSQNWPETTLRSICNPTQIWNPQKDKRDEFWYVDVSAVSRESLSIRNPQLVKASKAPSRARKIIKTGDTIFATIRPTLRRIAFVDKQFDNQIASTAFCVVRPNTDAAVPRFLYYLLQTDRLNEEIAKFESGANYPAVNDKDILDRTIELPSRPEQEKIATALWKIQRAIETEEKLIATARELKRSTMHQLFTHGLRAEPQRETEIGMIPETWEVVPLGRYLLLAQYGLSIRGQQVGRYPILRMNCQLGGKTIFRDLQFVDIDQKTFVAFQIKDGDLLFNRTNSFELVGRTSIFRSGREAVFASYLIRLTLDQSEYYPEFVNFYFNQPSVQADLKRLASRGVSQSNISASKLKEYYIPKTSLDEQREISGILQSVDRKIEIHERKRTALQELFKTMLHKLMTAEIRVADLDIDVSEIES